MKLRSAASRSSAPQSTKANLPMIDERVAVRGSQRRPVPDALPAGVPDPNALLSVTVVLRRRTDELPKPGSARVSREEFAELYGADPDSIPLIEAFAAENDLTIGEV